MIRQLRPTFVFLLIFTVLFGGIYPLASTWMTQLLFPAEAQGSLLHGKDGTLLGSERIGQNFTAPKYFWGRLSATSPYAYNAASSSGSNFGANNAALLDAVKGRIGALKAADPTQTAPIPVDLVTASGSGLDPEISPAAADYQVRRVARAQGLSEQQVQIFVKNATSERQFGVLGERRVHVLKLNLALDGKL